MIISGTPKSDTVKLHAKNLNITSVTVDSEKVKYDVGEDTITLDFQGSPRQRERTIGGAPVTTGRAAGAPKIVSLILLGLELLYLIHTSMTTAA